MDRRVEKVIALMRQDLRRELSLTKLAGAVNLSPSRLHQVFKDSTGLSPAKYLRSLRMQRAKELLETTQLSVKEIRNKVGATDESHFVRDFKKVYGLTPSQYRLKCLSAEAQGSEGRAPEPPQEISRRGSPAPTLLKSAEADGGQQASATPRPSAKARDLLRHEVVVKRKGFMPQFTSRPPRRPPHKARRRHKPGVRFYHLAARPVPLILKRAKQQTSKQDTKAPRVPARQPALRHWSAKGLTIIIRGDRKQYGQPRVVLMPYSSSMAANGSSDQPSVRVHAALGRSGPRHAISRQSLLKSFPGHRRNGQ